MVDPNETIADSKSSAGVRGYTMLGLLSLFLVMITLMDKNQDIWALFPGILGTICLILQVRFGPLLLLIAVGGMLLNSEYHLDPIRLIDSVLSGKITYRITSPAFLLSYGLLSTGMLVYSICFFRLRSISSNLFPSEPRRSWLFWKRQKPSDPQRRNPAGIRSGEIVRIPLICLGWSLVGLLLWIWLNRQTPLWGFNSATWKSLLLFWLFCLGLILTTVVLSYLGISRADWTTTRLMIQDTLWLETRGEQTKIHRLTTKKRLDQQIRKEKQ